MSNMGLTPNERPFLRPRGVLPALAGAAKVAIGSFIYPDCSYVREMRGLQERYAYPP